MICRQQNHLRYDEDGNSPVINESAPDSEQISTTKSLGVHIAENLTSECHINELSKNIASGVTDAIKSKKAFCLT